MTIILFYLLGFVIVLFSILYFKDKNYNKAIEAAKHLFNYDINNLEIKKQELDTIIEIQYKILFYISDGIHNIGGYTDIQKEHEIDLKEIGTFFAITRMLSNKLKSGQYTEERLKDILYFIENDFHDYCHYEKKKLDILKYEELVMF